MSLACCGLSGLELSGYAMVFFVYVLAFDEVFPLIAHFLAHVERLFLTAPCPWLQSAAAAGSGSGLELTYVVGDVTKPFKFDQEVS